MTLYGSPRRRSGQGRGPAGSGLYPELAAYRISEGNSPNVQSEVGRLVGQMPIEAARAELERRGVRLDEQAVRRIANALGPQMLAAPPRDLMRVAAGPLPAGLRLDGAPGEAWWRYSAGGTRCIMWAWRWRRWGSTRRRAGSITSGFGSCSSGGRARR